MTRTALTANLLTSILLLPQMAMAAPLPKDVPAKHWAAGSVKRILHQKIMGLDPDGRFRGDEAVTRYELAVVLDRFVRDIEAASKPLHAEQTHAPVAIPGTASPPVRHALEHLVANGFLPPTSSLLTQDGTKSVTARELTDALASITIRLSDRAEARQKE